MRFEIRSESVDNKKNRREVRTKRRGKKNVGVFKEKELVEVLIGRMRWKMGEYCLVDEDIGDEAEISGGGWPLTATNQP